MQKWKKITIGLAIGALSFSALYFGALITVPKVVDLNKYKESVSTAIEKETGFKVSIEDISFKNSLTPYLKIHMFHTLVLYPNDDVFLKLKETDLKVKILPLLFKKIVIKDAKFTRPIINIILYKDFSTSLEKYINPKKTINTNGFVLAELNHDTLCERYKIKFKDESINKTFYLEGDELILKNLKLNDNAHVILKGSIFENKKEYIKYDVDLTSTISKGKPQFTFSPFKPIMDSDIKASVLGHLKIDENKNIYGNLKVSDLSLKLDDILSADNKADLKFNGKEVQIDSILHTSKTDSAKLNGTLSFGNKKQIDLTANAKNINLSNLTKIVSEVSEVLNIQNPLSDVNVSGVLNADFKINSDFKKLKSDGTLNISNTVIKHKSLPYLISDINAYINLNNNKIQIEKADIKVNKTPISLSGTINEDVSYDINASSENLKFEKYGASFKTDSVDVNIVGSQKNYKADVLCNNFILAKDNKKFSTPSLKFSLDEKKITIPENIISKELGLKISGEINDYAISPKGYINFEGDIPSTNLANFIKSEVKFPYKAFGTIKTNGKIQIFDKNINLQAKLIANENNYLSYMVIDELFKKTSTLLVDTDIKGNKIKINEISLNEEIPNKNKKIVSLNGEIQLDKEVKLNNIKVSVPESLTVATNFFGGEEVSLKANLNLNNTLKMPEIKGNIKLSKYNLKKYLTSIKNADISFSDNNIRIIAPNMLVNESSFNMVADVLPTSDLSKIVISNLQLNSLNLDLNSILALIERERNPFTESKLTIQKGVATVNNFKIANIKARDISSDIKVENNQLKLSNIMANAYNGYVEGRAIYDLTTGVLNLDMSGKGLDIKNSLYDLCKIEDNLAGTADFNAKLSFVSGNENTILKSLSGIMQFDAINGRMGTLGKFEYYLYAQNLLYHGFLNATLNRIVDSIVHDNTAQYRNASGSVLFQNGYIITDDIQTSGSKMSLYLKGRHNMLTNQANIDIYGRISDEITNKLGSMGNISISEMINGQKAKKDVTYTVIPKTIMEKIPDLYNQSVQKTNTFKVNIYGDISAINAINSFVWTISDDNLIEDTDKVPNFSDMIKNL